MLLQAVASLSALAAAHDVRGAVMRPSALVTFARGVASAPVRARSAHTLAMLGAEQPDEPLVSPSAPLPAQPKREVDLRGFLVPVVNDVVRYPSKWPGEYVLGAVDFVQTLGDDRGYLVDLRPLRSIGKERWASKWGAKLVQEDVGRCRVVKEATYDEKKDEFFVPEAVSAALIQPLAPKLADPERVSDGLDSYSQFKLELLKETAIISLVGAGVAFGYGGLAQAEAYALGAAAGLAYISLLSLNVDTVGTPERNLQNKLSSLRFLAPAVPFVAVAAAKYSEYVAAGGVPSLLSTADGSGQGFFASQLIPPEQFLALALGVLTHRGPLIAREVGAVASTTAETMLGSSTRNAAGVDGSSAGSASAGGRKAAELPAAGSVVAAAQLFTSATKAADQAAAAAAARDAEARAAAGKRRPLVLCGPSAVGKSTLIKRLLAEFGPCFAFCVSSTTRAPREGEVDGVDYYFSSTEAFEREIADGRFVEWVRSNETYYGTSLDAVQATLASGKAALLDVDVAGAKKIYAMPDLDPCCVFVSPPSLQELENRMRARGANSGADMAYRLKRASAEVEAAATSRIFEHYLINDNVDETYEQLRDIALDANRWAAPYQAARAPAASGGDE